MERVGLMQYLAIHPRDPQPRLIRQAVERIRAGAVLVYPTDSAYALGCHIGDKAALERIRAIRKLDERHNFTLMCRDLSELSTYAVVDNASYRLLRAHTPGPYTFILKATGEVPRRLLHPKRKTIGLRVPDNRVALALLEELGEPIMSATLILPGEELPMAETEDMREKLSRVVDLLVDGGGCGLEPTTIVDLSGDVPEVLRQGKGRSAAFD
jgi:tRNA threonylcarbamoyl adenosine modification protein (Sua5/YciO/YrdC/YwlC family)